MGVSIWHKNLFEKVNNILNSLLIITLLVLILVLMFLFLKWCWERILLRQQSKKTSLQYRSTCRGSISKNFRQWSLKIHVRFVCGSLQTITGSSWLFADISSIVIVWINGANQSILVLIVEVNLKSVYSLKYRQNTMVDRQSLEMIIND